MGSMYVGIDIGGTTIKHGVVDDSGQVLEKAMIETNHHKEELIRFLITIIENYQLRYPIRGVGISAPGIIQKNGFMTTAGAIKSLYGTNLKEKIEKQVALPVIVENDANAAAIAERWIGNAKDCDNYLCVVLGTGVGGGIVINGDVYRGAHGMAGEFGFMMIKELPDLGNIEKMSLNRRSAVVGGLVKLYNTTVESTKQVENAKQIFERQQQGEPLAIMTLKRFYQDTAVGILNLIGSFDPEVILIGGGISANQAFMNELQAQVNVLIARHESLNYLKDKTVCQIKPAKLKNDAGMIGAVYRLKKQLEI